MSALCDRPKGFRLWLLSAMSLNEVIGYWEGDLSMLSWPLRRLLPPLYIVISAPPPADAVTTPAERRPSSPLALGKLLRFTPLVF